MTTAAPSSAARGLALLVACAALSGCSCARYRLLAADSRAKVEERQRFALLATRLEESDGFADPPSVGEVLAEHYRTRPDDAAPWSVRRVEEAPAPLREALAAARAALLEKGYAPATAARGAGAPDLVVLISLSQAAEGGPLQRVAVEIGGPIDDRFERALVSLDATLPEDGSCDATAAELVRELVGALPERAREP